jgi:hypothetical protein
MMGRKDERIRELEAKIAELEARIAVLEAKPWYVPYTEPAKPWPWHYGPYSVPLDTSGQPPPEWDYQCNSGSGDSPPDPWMRVVTFK